jgi:hypothetical protein
MFARDTRVTGNFLRMLKNHSHVQLNMCDQQEHALAMHLRAKTRLKPTTTLFTHHFAQPRADVVGSNTLSQPLY